MENTHSCKTYEVAGRGDFPMDMLRYDQACPARGEDASRIAQTLTDLYNPTPTSTRRVDWENPIRINVYARHGATVARWLSFGWSVREMV